MGIPDKGENWVGDLINWTDTHLDIPVLIYPEKIDLDSINYPDSKSGEMCYI